LENLCQVLEDDSGAGQEIFVDTEVARKAMIPLQRMLDFGRSLKR